MTSCCVCHRSILAATSREEGLTLHRFPSSQARPVISAKWRKFARIPDGERIRGRRICSAHFRAEDFIANAPKRKLRCGAVPCLRSPSKREEAMKSFASVPPSSVCADNEPVPASEGEEEIVASSATGQWATSSSSPEVTTPSGKWQVEDPQTEPLTPSSQIRIRSGGVLKNIGATRVKDLTPRKRLMYYDLQERKSKIRHLQERVKFLQDKVLSNRRRTKEWNHLADDIGQHISPLFYDLLKAQLSNKPKSPFGRRWSTDVKVICLALRNRSLQAYKLLRKFMLLPSPNVLLQLSNKIPFHVGLDDILLQHLGDQLKHMTPNSKICSLIFDEMAIQKNVTFSVSRNYIFGYEDIGSQRRCQYADHALVFMVRGLIDNWKQPVAYYLTHGTISATDLEKIIIEVTGALQRIGFNIMAIVSDQASTKVRCLKTLALKTCNWNRPILEINQCKIVVIADPPHVLKSTRNALLDNKIIFKTDSGEVKETSWQYLVDLFELEKKSFNKTMGNITYEHIYPKRKMKVKLAAQVLSVTVANALHKCGVEGAKYLTEFINDITRLFDSFNGLKFDDTHFYRRPLSNTSEHLQFWQCMKRKLDSWQFIGADGKPARTKVKEAWCRNIDAVSTLWSMLRDLGVTSLATRRLNQDPLENLFGVVRQRGIRNNNPTSLQFDLALKSCILNGMIGANGKLNCEKDDADVLTNLREFVSKIESVGATDTHVCDVVDNSSFLKGGKEVKTTCAWILSMPSDPTNDPLIADEATSKALKIINKIPNLKSCHSCFVSFICCHHSPPHEGSHVLCVCSKPNQITVKIFWELSLKMLKFLEIKGHTPKLLEELQNLSKFRISIVWL